MNIWHSVYRILSICCYFFLLPLEAQEDLQETSGTLWIMVRAPHLDYTNFKTLLKTLAKNPRTGSKEGHFGHAWIRLTGHLDNHYIWIEGGHSGDTGVAQARYVDGLMDMVEADAPNPVSYLWSVQRDGFFQKGSGGHYPTYAVAIPLNQEKLRRIVSTIENYPYARYSLTHNQCVEFVRTLAKLAGVSIPSCKRDIHIPNALHLGSYRVPLWSDQSYSLFRLSTVDDLEYGLKQLQHENKVVDVTYKSKLYYQKNPAECLSRAKDKVQFFWERCLRWIAFSSL